MIRILGGQLSLGGLTISLYSSPIIDGSNTNLVGSARPLFTVANAATIEGVRIASTAFNDPVIAVSAGGALEFAASTIDTAEVQVNAGSANIVDVQFINARLDCTNAVANVRRSRFERSTIEPENTMLSVSASLLGPSRSSTAVIQGDGLLKIENNVFVEVVSGRAAMTLFGFSNGSSIRFNTIINTSTPNTGTSLFCPDGLDVTSNIFAVNSATPVMPCIARYSLFDTAGAPIASTGTNNVVGESATFFKNPAASDYHLNTGSPAINKAEPNLVTADFDGHQRGAQPDIGAYEAP